MKGNANVFLSFMCKTKFLYYGLINNKVMTIFLKENEKIPAIVYKNDKKLVIIYIFWILIGNLHEFAFINDKIVFLTV